MARIRLRTALVVAVVLVCLAPLGAQNTAKRAMDIDDAIAFPALSQASLSPNGQWLAYRMAPSQGDADVTIRSVAGAQTWTIPAGQGGGSFSFSDDSKWVAIGTSPTKREADQARRTRRTLQNGVTIVNLATGDKTNLEKVRRFAFNGEMGGWIALDKYGPQGAGGGAAAAGGGRGGRGGGAPAGGGGARSTAPRGTDLVLRELATGVEMNIGNVSEYAFDKSGTHLALVIDAADQAGNGVLLRDMATGAITPLDTDKAFYERLSWSDEGDALSVLKGHDDRAYKERLFDVIGWTDVTSAARKKVEFDPTKAAGFPEMMSVSGNRSPRWTESRDALVFGIADITKAEPPARGRGAGAGANANANADDADASANGADTSSDRPDLIIWHYKDPRLQSEQQVQESRDRQFNYLSEYRVAENRFIRLADDEVRDVSPAPKDKWAIGSDSRAYELEGNLDGRRYRDVYAIDMTTGARTPIKKKVRWGYSPSPDGTKWFYYENKQFHVVDLPTGADHAITTNVPASFVDVEDDHNVVDPPLSPVGWTSDSASLLLSDDWDVWRVPVDATVKAVNLTVNGKKDSIRYLGRVRIDPEEKGIDLSKPQVLQRAGRVDEESRLRCARAWRGGRQDAHERRRDVQPADEGEGRRRLPVHARDADEPA